jgi:hypothetical protein
MSNGVPGVTWAAIDRYDTQAGLVGVMGKSGVLGVLSRLFSRVSFQAASALTSSSRLEVIFIGCSRP